MDSGNLPIISCDSATNIYPSTATSAYLGINWSLSTYTPIQPAPDSGTSFAFNYSMYPVLPPGPLSPKTGMPCATPASSPSPDAKLTANAYWGVTASTANFPSTGGPGNTGVGSGSGNTSQILVDFPAGSTTDRDFVVTGTVVYNSGGNPVTVALGPTVIRIRHG